MKKVGPRVTVIKMGSDKWTLQWTFLRPAQWLRHNKALLTPEENPFLVVPALRGEPRAAVALGWGGVTHTPQCFVQMELPREPERGIKRIEMCSSVKLKGAQHDIQHDVLGLVKSSN